MALSRIVGCAAALVALACAESGSQVSVAWELDYFGAGMTCTEIDIEEIVIVATRQDPAQEQLTTIACPEGRATLSVDPDVYLFEIRAVDVDESAGLINRDVEGTLTVGPVDASMDVDLGTVTIEIVELPPF